MLPPLPLRQGRRTSPVDLSGGDGLGECRSPLRARLEWNGPRQYKIAEARCSEGSDVSLETLCVDYLTKTSTGKEGIPLPTTSRRLKPGS
jgi:hypothetical protein